MTVKVLKPTTAPIPWDEQSLLPRCQHSVNMSGQVEWRKAMVEQGRGRYGEGRLDQCTRDAVVEVDGIPYCRRHGGQVVLNKYILNEIIDLPRHKRPCGKEYKEHCECGACWQEAES